MATTKLSPLSPVRPDDKRRAPAASVVLKVQDSSAAEAYEQYLRLPELSRLWKAACCPGWPDEGLVKPALQALEITFRFVSVALSDPRGYASRRELARRLESLAAREVEVVAALCEGDRGAPLAELSASEGVLPRERSASEVWQLPGSTAAVVCHASESSLLPRLAAWDKSETLAAKIKYAIESQMQGCAFSLGLGEPNLAGKPVLEYDRVVQPHELHALKPRVAPEPKTGYRNRENEALFTIHQILESWLCAASQLLTRLNSRIEAKDWEARRRRGRRQDRAAAGFPGRGGGRAEVLLRVPAGRGGGVWHGGGVGQPGAVRAGGGDGPAVADVPRAALLPQPRRRQDVLGRLLGSAHGRLLCSVRAQLKVWNAARCPTCHPDDP
uniref:Uncharacterized protein n=1 Tax=Aegilops tauschii subsp. strangulata TaxID=200361 RepID=A0A453FY64_AEGTS